MVEDEKQASHHVGSVAVVVLCAVVGVVAAVRRTAPATTGDDIPTALREARRPRHEGVCHRRTAGQPLARC